MSPPSPKSVLLLIDLQRAIDHPDWGCGIIRMPKRRSRGWRGKDWPVWHVRHDSVDPHSNYRPVQPDNNFKLQTAPLGGEPVIAKKANSAFIGTGPEQKLREASHTDLVIAGVITNNSIETTVRMGGNHGSLPSR